MYLFVILILRRDRARTLLESPPERTDRMESGTFGNLLYTGIRLGIHQALAFLDPELVDIIGERLSQLPVKQLGKIRTADRKIRCKSVRRKSSRRYGFSLSNHALTSSA